MLHAILAVRKEYRANWAYGDAVMSRLTGMQSRVRTHD